MINQKNKLTIIILMILMFSCENDLKKLKHNTVIENFKEVKGLMYKNKKLYSGKKWIKDKDKEKLRVYNSGILKKEIEWKDNGDRIEIEFYNGKAIKRDCWDKDNKICPACRNHDILGRKQGPMGNYSYKAGKVEGRYVRYHDNGKLKYETTYKNGKIEGKVTQWYDNGQKEYTTFIKDGLREGNTFTWYRNGKLKYKRVYKNGKLIKFDKFIR